MESDLLGILLLSLILVLTLFLWSAGNKGKQGEAVVNADISHRLDSSLYRLITNVTLPIDDGTTQIDHLVVSRYGIFVIETKNISGWIFGQADQSQWTRVHFQSKHRFQNPIRQNYMHVKAVRDLLNLRRDHVYNVVAFVGDSTFKTPMPAGVVDGTVELTNFIQSKRTPVFTDGEIGHFVDLILDKRLAPGFRTERTHLRNVRRRLSERAAIPENICPRCRGEMLERVNKRTGERFLGCKRYPQCRGTRPLG